MSTGAKAKYNYTELLFADMKSDETVVTILQEQDIRLIFLVHSSVSFLTFDGED